MRRIDRLLIQVREAEKLDALQLTVAFIEHDQTSGKWKAVANLWDGVQPPNGRTERIELECDTLEEAQEAVDGVNRVHAPTGKRAKAGAAPVVITNTGLED